MGGTTTSEIRLQLQDSQAYLQFANSLTRVTKIKYTEGLIDFLKHNGTTAEEIVKLSPKEIQSKLVDYTVDMKDNRDLSPNTMRGRVAAIQNFFEMNDVEDINWKRVKKYQGEHYLVTEDRPYTREEIKLLVDAAHGKRDKAIILLLASSGIRKGGILKLQLKHLRKIDKYYLFAIEVYKKSKEYYYTFCTPEATKAIEEYLDWRKRLGEILTPDSILFRQEFDSRWGVRLVQAKPKPITENAVKDMIQNLRNETAIVDKQPLGETVSLGTHRSKIMTTHGLRKFFDTTCTSSGMEAIYVEMVMGHNLGIKKSYYKPQLMEILEGNDRMRGYISVIDDLTINDENRLRMKVVQQGDIINKRMKEKDNQIANLEKKLKIYDKNQDALKRFLKDVKAEINEVRERRGLRNSQTPSNSSN